MPVVLSYDATTQNSLKREYMLQNRCSGVAVSDIYDTLNDSQKDKLINQLIDMQEQLHKHSFTTIGGLVHSPDDPAKIISGPILDEWFWFLPDIKLYFPNTEESYSSMNACGPYLDYVSLVTDTVKRYKHIIQTHSSLASILDLAPRLDAFLQAISDNASVLNNIPIRLAHKDLHFANILCDPATCNITVILDWEFAGTVPSPRWDPPKAFLWNAQPGEKSLKEKYRLRERLEELCKEREKEVLWLKDREFTSEKQESMHNVTNYLRWMTTMVPKKPGHASLGDWKVMLVKELKKFGV